MSQRQILLNPLNKFVTWAQIKNKREILKREPITIPKGTFDVDNNSFQNIITAISAFDSLADPITNLLNWKLEDNTFVNVLKTDLEEVRNEVAIRANILHTNAEIILAADLKVGEIEDLTLWGVA